MQAQQRAVRARFPAHADTAAVQLRALAAAGAEFLVGLRQNNGGMAQYALDAAADGNSEGGQAGKEIAAAGKWLKQPDNTLVSTSTDSRETRFDPMLGIEFPDLVYQGAFRIPIHAGAEAVLGIVEQLHPVEPVDAMSEIARDW